MARSPLRIPVQVEAEWTTRFWTTEPPRYLPHTEWSVRINLTAGLPLRVATIKSDAAGNSIEKSHDRGQAFSLALAVSTQVQPAPADLEDPWLVLGVELPRGATTWSRIVVQSDQAGRAEVIAFPRQDTESLRNGRWRVRRDLQAHLDQGLATLAEGAWQ